MRYSNEYNLWTKPRKEQRPGDPALSPILFRTDTEFGQILAARAPSPGVTDVGDRIYDRLGFSQEAVRYLLREEPSARPLFVFGNRGVGLLMPPYGLSRGLGLYLHLHCRPASAARVLGSGLFDREADVESAAENAYGPLRKEDEPTAALLLRGLRLIQYLRDTCLPNHQNTVFHVETLREEIRHMAEWIGYPVTFGKGEDCLPPAGNVSRVRVPDPAALKCLLLYHLIEMSAYGEPRGSTWFLGSIDGEEDSFLYLSLSYVASLSALSPRERICLSNARLHMAHIAEMAGAGLTHSPVPMPSPDGKRRRKILPLEPVCATLDWVEDPAVLPSSDLKDDPKLRDEQDP